MRLENIFPEYANLKQVDIVNRVVLPKVGRTERKSISLESYPDIDSSRGFNACYKRLYHDVTVFWDGEVYPCCSVYNRATPKISMGNLYRETLSQIWDRLEGSLWLRTIKREGFEKLYSVVTEIDPDLATELPDPSQMIGACHLCNTVFNNSKIVDRIFAAFEMHERNQVLDLLEFVRSNNGTQIERAIILDALEAIGDK